MQLRIRPMRDDDREAIARLHRRAVEAVPDLSAADRESWATGIGPELYGHGEDVLVAELDGVPAGFCAWRHRGEVTALYVDPDFQRRSVARRLLGRAESLLRHEGVERVQVRSSLAGRPFYARQGYAETSRSTHRTRGGRELPDVRMEKPLDRPWRNFYGRRHGKTLKAGQREALGDLAHLSPGPVSWEENPDRHPLDVAARFGGRPLWLEIGFGGGEHMLHQARLNPEAAILGAEPFINGVAMLLTRIREAGAENVAIHAGDARDLFDVLPPGSVARVFLLYPDPWPKKRHHRRRFVTAEHLAPLRRIMAPGAELRIATDIPDYVRQTLEEVPRAGFAWTAERAADWRTPWPDWTRTRYEAKAVREGRTPCYLTFRATAGDVSRK